MSSTSSSECICGECFNYGPGFGSRGFLPGPAYYQALGHPLIYCAQVQQTPNYRKRSKESNPNCFVKAFRWYTQEHHPPPSRELPNERTDLVGFSTWLDKKYDEFMLDKHAEQKTFQLKLKQTSILEANKNSASAVHDVRVKKRFARMKSPWRKRRRSVTSKEAGDVLEKCNQSFEFIMKPKELSRPTSECCNHVSCNRSNASSETQISKKTFVKSHSSDRTVYEKQNVTPIEVIKPEGSNDKTVKLSRSKSQMKTKSKAPTKEMKDVECQCPEEKFEISDADIQCDIIDRKALVESPMSDYSGNRYYMREHTSNAVKLSAVSSQVGAEDGSNPKKFRAMHPLHNARSETSTSCQCSEIMIVKRDVQSQHVREQVDATCCCCISCEFKPLSRASSSHQNHPRIVVRPSLKLQPPHPIVIKNAGSDGTQEFIPLPIPAEYEHGEAQTSDHSICLDKNTYPLFMKIICADKLKEEMIRK